MDINKNVPVKVANARRKSDLDNIYKSKFFYYIKDGDFDIVWTIVSIFVLGHILYFYGLYTLYNEWLITTWIYSN